MFKWLRVVHIRLMARWGLPPSYSILWIQKIKDKLIPCSGVIATERSHHYAKNQQDKAKTLRVDKMNNMVHSYKDRIPIWAYNTRSPESPQKTTKVDVFCFFFLKIHPGEKHSWGGRHIIVKVYNQFIFMRFTTKCKPAVTLLSTPFSVEAMLQHGHA